MTSKSKNAREAVKETRLSLPDALELTKIAASLKASGNLTDDDSIKQAIALFLKAKSTASRLTSIPLEHALVEIDDIQLMNDFLGESSRPRTVRLYPDNAKINHVIEEGVPNGGLCSALSYIREKAIYAYRCHRGKSPSFTPSASLKFRRVDFADSRRPLWQKHSQTG